MCVRYLCNACERPAGDCQCTGPTFRFRKVDHEFALLKAARELCDALEAHGFGSTSDRALPGEFDALRAQVVKSERAQSLQPEQEDA